MVKMCLFTICDNGNVLLCHVSRLSLGFGAIMVNPYFITVCDKVLQKALTFTFVLFKELCTNEFFFT
jgi:hypothetical protein